VGPVGSQEDAAFSLVGDVPAGLYHVICDAIVIQPVDVSFALIWRRGTMDTVLSSWTKHFDPLPGGNYDAQPYETNREVQAIFDVQPGDQLVFRYEGNGDAATPMYAFTPNGDGERANGRIPNITLPE
jgi:hypothetical protein